jgi:hypothetical protein
MRVSILLADKGTNNPQAGTLNLLNVGWKATRLNPAPMVPGGFITAAHAIAIFFEVEHQRCNHPIALVLRLVTEDGESVQMPGPNGPQDLVITQTITVVSPPGVPMGTLAPGNALVEILPGLPIPAGGYRWEATLDGQEDEDWIYSFRVAEAPQAAGVTFGNPGTPPPAGS